MVPYVLEALDVHVKFKTGRLVEGKKVDSVSPLLDKVAEERGE